MEHEYIISVLTEDKPGMLNKLTIVLSRRKINISSLNVSVTEVNGVSRFTIVAFATKEQLEKVVKQIRKLVDVLGAFLYEEHEAYFHEIALYKISKDVYLRHNLEEVLIRPFQAKLIAEEGDQMVFEKTGTKQETHELYEAFLPFGILEFARSGRVALSKSTRKTEAYIKELENSDTKGHLSIKSF